jgi:hypothetical protein
LSHPQAYKNTRGGEKGPDEFLRAFGDCWPLVLPVRETRAIMTLKENDSFQPLMDELNTICMSCRLGMSCFNFALKLILADQLQEKTEKAVQVGLAFSCAVKGRAVETGKLMPIFAED